MDHIGNPNLGPTLGSDPESLHRDSWFPLWVPLKRPQGEIGPQKKGSIRLHWEAFGLGLRSLEV